MKSVIATFSVFYDKSIYRFANYLVPVIYCVIDIDYAFICRRFINERSLRIIDGKL